MDQTIAGTIRKRAADSGDRPALTFEGQTITYGELDEAASRVGNALRADGISPGDRVAYLGKNLPEYFEVLFGGAKVGAVNVAVNWRLAPPEIAHVVNDSGAKVLVVDADLLAQVEPVEAQLAVDEIIVIGDGDGRPGYEDWVGAQSSADPGFEQTPEDIAFQYYTSGTTGLPKGAMLSGQNLFAGLPWYREELTVEPDSVFLVMMPLFHISGSGWALVGLAYGAHCVMLREVDLGPILEAIPKYRISHVVFVPALLQFILATPGVDEVDLSSLEVLAYGASPISDEVLTAALERFRCRFYQMYGLTETSGGIVVLPPEDHDPGGPSAHRLRSAGRPIPGVELRVVEPTTGDEAGADEVGEVWIRAPQVMAGYWNMPSETKEAISPDGWFRSGDAGYLDGDGYLYIQDRVKDMIISGGENIYPAEVENALLSHPGIADVAVIGVPDDKWGETVKAIVVKAPDQDPTEKQIIAFSREKVAHYKCPTSVDFVSELPRNPTGKVLKHELRDPYWRGQERRVH